ncbi:MAG: D-erythronate dehydrogenase [Pseudomonadota bacterium]
MHILITGGAGMLGLRLAQALANRGHLNKTPITKLTLFDQVAPPQDDRWESLSGDITNPQTIRTLVTRETAVIIHLAAVVSGQAEQDFDLGMQVNLAATQHLLETCRQLETTPRVLFASSIAVYGGDMPAVIEDGTYLAPQSSYGTQKAIAELLINDYSRKGFIDGGTARLPTIVVRPGRPNQATSTFASSIIREPLQGETAICAVSPETRLWILSPGRAIESLTHAAELPAGAWGNSRAMALPGLSVSVQEMVDGLRQIAGQNVVDRIEWKPDPFIQNIVGSWPAEFNPKRAKALGFKADDSMQAIIQSFIDDELGGTFIP